MKHIYMQQQLRYSHRFWITVHRWWQLIEKAGVVIAGGSAILIALLLLAEVVSRVILNQGAVGMKETTELLVVVIAYLPLAYIEKLQEHIRVRFILDRLPPKMQMIMEILSLLIGLIFCVAITIPYSRFAVDSLLIRQMHPSFPIPIYPFKLLVLVGFILIIVRLILRVIESVVGMRDRKSMH